MFVCAFPLDATSGDTAPNQNQIRKESYGLMQVRFVSCVHCCSAERSILISSGVAVDGACGVGLAGRDVARGSGAEERARCARALVVF